jgi:hypothetical protein
MQFVLFGVQNRMQFVLCGVRNKTRAPYVAAMHWILVSVMKWQLCREGDVEFTLGYKHARCFRFNEVLYALVLAGGF